MEKMTFGPVEGKVLTYLRGEMLHSGQLARRVYEVRREEEPTRSQKEVVRQALRNMERRGFVKLTRFHSEQQRCWELTGKMVPAPKKKKPTTSKNHLSIVEP